MKYAPSFSDQMYMDIQPSYKDSLMHHGIKGMRWGVRRYQNPDGTLTSAGKAHRSSSKNVGKSKIDKTAVAKRAARLGGSVAGSLALGYIASKAVSNPHSRSAMSSKPSQKSVDDILSSPDYGPEIVRKDRSSKTELSKPTAKKTKSNLDRYFEEEDRRKRKQARANEERMRNVGRIDNAIGTTDSRGHRYTEEQWIADSKRDRERRR